MTTTRPSQVSRRQFLRRSAAAAGAALATSAGRAWARPSDFVPAIVIGSGFGGAVAALRLGQAGIDTLVLERGRRWPIRPDGNTFATFEQPDGRGYWLREASGEDILGLPQLVKPVDRFTGVIEIIEGDGMYIGAGAGVGGGSLVFNAIIVKPNRALFDRLFSRAIDGRRVDRGEHGPRQSLVHDCGDCRAVHGSDSPARSAQQPPLAVLARHRPLIGPPRQHRPRRAQQPRPAGQRARIARVPLESIRGTD